jgi:hypothetical protein
MNEEVSLSESLLRHLLAGNLLDFLARLLVSPFASAQSHSVISLYISVRKC